VSGNAVQGDGEGGGIYNSHTLTLTDSTVSGNSAGFSGGGIYNGGLGEATLTAMNSTVSENTAARGGGIMTEGPATLSNCTVSDNSSDDEGGGILFSGYGTLTLTNSTISRNTSNNYGGGISLPGGEGMTLTSCTIAENAAFEFDAIYVGSPGTVTWTNTVIQGDCSNPASVFGGNNVESPGDTCGFDQPTDQVNVSADDLKLGELADNGGPTMTHALGEDSVAIDQIPEANCEVDTDQRRLPRPAGTTDPKRCDVGAFEVQP
jgi:hypothetical protein